MADICFQVKRCWITGVWPRNAHVRVTGHFSESPDSSMKTIVRSLRRDFFAPDDFGTGYSCLRHLKSEMLSDHHAQDRPVVRRRMLPDDARDRTIVHTVIELAHGLGMEEVAKGVETEASLDLLRQAGYDAAQGFLFAKPMPAAECARFVNERRAVAMRTNEPTVACHGINACKGRAGAMSLPRGERAAKGGVLLMGSPATRRADKTSAA